MAADPADEGFPLGTVADQLDALRATFAPPAQAVDFTAPCAHRIPRPRHLENRKIQGHKAGDLFCNRPGRHRGPHRVYSAEFHVLAEVAE